MSGSERSVPAGSGLAPQTWEPAPATVPGQELERTPPSPAFGELIVARNRKFNGKAHWVTPGRYLGQDEHGTWIYQGAGEFISRPDAAFYAHRHAVLLIPAEGDWVATFYEPDHPTGTRIYVDMASELHFRRIRPHVIEFHMIDMDLDVIRLSDGTVYLDDEDEFAEHQIQMDYPAELIAATAATGKAVLAAVKAGLAPFGGQDAAWLRLGEHHALNQGWPDPHSTPSNLV